MDAEARLIDNGYEGIKYLTDYSYDTALIGVSEDNRAVYDYNKMVEWLMEEEEMSAEEATSGLTTTQSGHFHTLERTLPSSCIR